MQCRLFLHVDFVRSLDDCYCSKQKVNQHYIKQSNLNFKHLMQAVNQQSQRMTQKILSEVFEITYHPVLKVYQLNVGWQGSEQRENIFLPESILFRGLEDSLKIEESYEDSVMEQSSELFSVATTGNFANDHNSECAWKSQTRPQRELREMMERNLHIFEEAAKEEEQR